MNNQTIHQTKLLSWFLPIFLGLLTACTSSDVLEANDTSQGKAQVTFHIAARAVNGATTSKEDQIQSLRIYAFRKSVQRTDILEGYYYIEPNSATTSITLTLPTDLIDFYFIANEKEAGPLVDRMTGLDYTLPGPTTMPATGEVDLTSIQVSSEDLNNLTFSKLPEATYVSGGNAASVDETGKIYEAPLLPMATVESHRISNNITINVELIRSVAKLDFHFCLTGAGEVYLGRGIYLYNEPKYGFLFPKSRIELMNANIEYDRKEKTRADRPPFASNNPFYCDSYPYQLNGKTLLRCGWPDEPDDPALQDSHLALLDINRVTVNVNNPDPTQRKYQQIPHKSIYLFANPNVILDPATGKPFLSSTTKPNSLENGYYLKIAVHEHLNQGGTTIHQRERFCVCLPQVAANDHISLYSTLTLDGHVVFQPNWMVNEWKTGGGDITFN